jgi:DUF971 family protein
MTVEVEARSVNVEADALVIVWADERVSRIGLVDLRRNCPCAQCRELRDRGETIWPRPGAPGVLEVTGAELVGAYGLSLRWNDRHETGIYPWEMLRAQ